MRTAFLGVLTITACLALTTTGRADDQAGEPEKKKDDSRGVKVVPDIVYYEGKDADPKKHKLDLYLPEGKKDFPVVFFVHGGGWTIGDRKQYIGLGRVLARQGVGVVIPSYRLTPAVQHPGHIEDVARAFAWTHKNIANHGGRPDRMFVTGQSAGGHLAALLATNESFLKEQGLTVGAIRGAMPISGIYMFGPRMLKRVIGDAPGAAESASPVKHVTGKEPPFLIFYADQDFKGCDVMSRAFHEALKAKSVEAELVEVKDRNHISIIVRPMFNEADPVVQALLGFVAKHGG
jgi:acetyl esterase/lipase